jgi:chaperone LolA
MKIMTIFMICGLCAGMFGVELDEIIEKTVEHYRGLTSFYAEFEQVFCDEVSGTCASYDGKIYFLEPNFFRMEIDEPKKIYIGDSISLWIYLPEEKRAIRQTMTGMPFHINPDMFLTDYDKRYDAALSDDTTSSYEVILTPLDETELYEKIIISISKQTFKIGALAVYDEIGSENKYTFQKFETNKKIARDMFIFKPPSGTQIDEF